MINTLTLSIISTIIFGLIDASIFLIGDIAFHVITGTTRTQFLISRFSFDLGMTEMVTGGLASSSSILITNYIIPHHLYNKYNLINSPIIDSIGIILGTLIIVLIYKYYFKVEKIKKIFMTPL